MMNFTKSIQILIICLIVNSVSGHYYKIVNTTHGRVRGYRMPISNYRNVYAWKGIKYAEPPIEELRFKPPVPKKPWRPRIVDAIHHSKICPQKSYLLRINKPQDEDCLSLNIYVPDVKVKDLMAVLFWIHGGANLEGSGDAFIYKPHLIAREDVIMVTLNYRLNLFGFLSFGTPEESGNNGVKDQQLALKWIHANIDRFGGDPERITLFGESSGASLVHLHIYSEESRNYFKNAVIMSGTGEDPWALEHDESVHSLIRGEMIQEAIKRGLPMTVDFFRTTPAKQLLSLIDLPDLTQTLNFKFSPIIESKRASKPFLSESPREILRKTNITVDILIGTANLEGLWWIGPRYPFIRDFESYERDFSFESPTTHTPISLNPPVNAHVASRLKQHYMGGLPISGDTIPQYAKFFGYLNFGYGTELVARLHSLQSKVYRYEFSVDSLMNIAKISRQSKIPGATHGDELCYVFRCDFLPMDEDVYNFEARLTNPNAIIARETIVRFVTLITNMAKYNHPSPPENPIVEFKHVQGTNIHFVNITNEGLFPGMNPNEDCYQQWSSAEDEIATPNQNVVSGVEPEHDATNINKLRKRDRFAGWAKKGTTKMKEVTKFSKYPKFFKKKSKTQE